MSPRANLLSCHRRIIVLQVYVFTPFFLTIFCNFHPGAVDSFLDNAQVSLSWIVACNHMKAVAYFTSSINSPCAMKAFPCDNWEDFQEGNCLSCDGACPQMGYNADQHRAKERVLAFLKTVEDKPFCGK